MCKLELRNLDSAAMPHDPAPAYVEEFMACVAEYHRLRAELRRVEDQMLGAVQRMHSEQAPVHRLLAARQILGKVQDVVRAAE